jgi:hypothetical protein
MTKLIVFTQAGGERVLTPNYELRRPGESEADFLGRMQKTLLPPDASDPRQIEAADYEPMAPSLAEEKRRKQSALRQECDSRLTDSSALSAEVWAVYFSKRDDIIALVSVDAVASYDVTSGWP